MTGQPPPAFRFRRAAQRRCLARLEYENAKLRKINAALIDRVERSTDLSHSAFSMFERAITLEQLVRDRTRELEEAMGELATVNAKLANAHANAEAAETRLRDAIDRSTRALPCSTPKTASSSITRPMSASGLKWPTCWASAPPSNRSSASWPNGAARSAR
jgi:septal ring factor EnvC (AmiA/AmiB activator)